MSHDLSTVTRNKKKDKSQYSFSFLRVLTVKLTLLPWTCMDRGFVCVCVVVFGAFVCVRVVVHFQSIKTRTRLILTM